MVLFDAADPVLKPRRSRNRPIAGKGFRVSDKGMEAFRIGAELNGRFFVIVDVRHQPRLRGVGNVAVGQHHDRRHVFGGDPTGADGDVEQSTGDRAETTAIGASAFRP